MRKNLWVLIIPILLLAVWVATPQFSATSLWYDEILTHFMSTTSIYDDSPRLINVLLRTAVDRAWPPGFYLVMLGWETLFGGTLFADRAIALMLGLLAISMVYQLGRTLFNPQIGLIGALLLTTSAFFAFYLHEMRGYTMYVFVVAWASWLYWLLMHSEHHRKRWVRWSFVIAISASLYTHYIAVGAVIGIIIYHFLKLFQYRRFTSATELRDDRLESNLSFNKRWQVTTRLGFIGCISFLPWTAILLYSFVIEADNVRGEPPLRLLQALATGFTNNLWWFALPLLIASLWWARKRDEVLFLWITGASVLLIALLGNIYASFLFHPRHIMGLMPAFFLLLAFMLWQVRQRALPVAGLAIVLWAGVGILAAQNADFMNAIPNHIPKTPLSFTESVQDVIRQCVADTDSVIIGYEVPDQEWIHDVTQTYYFISLGDFRLVTVSHLLPDVDKYRLILSRELEEGTLQGRIDYITENAETIWVISRPNIQLSDELDVIDTTLAQEGYQSCGVFIDDREVYGEAYRTNGTASCGNITLTCGS